MPQDCARPEVFCAGIVTDFGSVAQGIHREAWLGLQDAQSEGLLDRIDRIETVDPRDRAANIAVFAGAGYDIILTIGASIADETITAARQNPKLLFIGVEQPQNTKISNLVGLVFHEEQSGFLAGAAAALLTKTKRIAAICEERFIDSMRRYCEGFHAGAIYADPDVLVTVTFREGPKEMLYHDTVWGRTQTLKQLQQGADVLFAAGGATAEAALQAAAGEGAMVIGAGTDLYPYLVEVRPKLVTSATNNVRSGILKLLQLARQGQFPAGDFTGQVGLAPFHDLESLVPSDIKTRLDEIELGLETGSIQVNVPY